MDASAKLSCREASRLLSLACERPLSPDEQALLGLHLDRCLMCATFEKQLQFLRVASQRFREGG